MFDPSTRILVVDDFSSIRELMQTTLNELGFSQILQAENGEIAYRALSQIQPPVDLVISDWNMPKMDGLALLQRIRANPKLNSLPFILVTTESEKDRVLEAIQCGVTNYIVKPFDKETVRKKLQAAFQSAQTAKTKG